METNKLLLYEEGTEEIAVSVTKYSCMIKIYRSEDFVNTLMDTNTKDGQ